MTYTGPVFTTGPAQKRDDRVILEMLRLLRDSEQRNWMPGELGNREPDSTAGDVRHYPVRYALHAGLYRLGLLDPSPDGRR